MNNGIFALYVWFARTSNANLMRGFKSRIRSPRYAVALLLGIAYFFFVFVMPIIARSSTHMPPRDSGILLLTRSIGTLGIALLVGSWWVWRTDRDAIALAPAEVMLLVPAPLNRKQLIQFKLLRTQPRIMLSSLFVSLFAHSTALPLPLHFLSAWALFSTLQLHRYGASLVHTSLAEHGRAAWRRAWVASLVFAGITISVAYSMVQYFMLQTPRPGLSLVTLSESLGREPARFALAPFRALLNPLNAGSIDVWPKAFAIAVGLAILHYFWVIRTDAAFEEGAADAGVRRAAAVEAMRAGKNARAALRRDPGKAVKAAWFPLPARGEPVIGILWKNVLAVTRGFSSRMFTTLVSVVVFAVIFSMMPHEHRSNSGYMMVGMLASIYGVMIMLIGPSRIRHDFRTDLRRLDLIRTLPIGGARLAAAEVATSSIVLVLIQFALIGVGVTALTLGGKHLPHTWMYYLAIPAAVALILIDTTLLTLHNLSAILFPAWSRKPGGVEMFGMAMLNMIAGVIMLLLMLIGPALAAVACAAPTGLNFGNRAWLPAGAGFLVGLIIQLVLLLMWLGRAYDNMDITEVAAG